jgi:hypothetical protein
VAIETKRAKLSTADLIPNFRLSAVNRNAAIFVADRWGTIFSTRSIEKAQDLPAEAEIRDWLEFIELQCEECFPSEWTMRQDDRVFLAPKH